MSAPLVAALTKLGIESEAEARLPRVKANLPKTIAIEIARREDVAFVALQPYAAPRAPEPAPAPTVRVAPELRAGVFLVPNVDAGGYAILNARIGPVKEAKSGAVYHLTEGIGAYEASLSYDPEGLTVTGLAHIEPFAYGVSNLNTQQGSRTNFVAFVAAAVGPVPPVTVADVRLRLKGNKNSAYTAQLQMGLISTAGGELISQESPARLTFVRGDADSSGTVTAKDAMAIAQFLAGSRAIGLETTMINPVNAASVHPDGPEGDRVDATDALYIAQMLVGLRNESFDLK